jgi:hypothetical protein
VEIRFIDTFFSEDENAALKSQLQDFFNQPDVQKKLEAAARHIFPNLAKPSEPIFGYSMVSTGLTVFGLTAKMEGNPHNLCGALIHALAGLKEDKTMAYSTLEGLESCVKQMLTIVNADTRKSALKTAILTIANKDNVIDNRRAR